MSAAMEGETAAEIIRARADLPYSVGIILGSGLGGLADQTLILSPNHRPSLGATRDILTEAILSRTYGVPIRLVEAGDHIACVAEVE